MNDVSQQGGRGGFGKVLVRKQYNQEIAVRVCIPSGFQKAAAFRGLIHQEKTTVL